MNLEYFYIKKMSTISFMQDTIKTRHQHRKKKKKNRKLDKKFFKRVSKMKLTRNTNQRCSIKRTKMENCVMMLLFVKTNKNNSFNWNHFEGGFVYSHVFITMFSTLSAPKNSSKQQLSHRNKATTEKNVHKCIILWHEKNFYSEITPHLFHDHHKTWKSCRTISLNCKSKRISEMANRYTVNKHQEATKRIMSRVSLRFTLTQLSSSVEMFVHTHTIE